MWTEAPLEDLIVEDGRVVGVRTVRDGAPVLDPGPAGASCWPPEGSPTTPRCEASSEATSRTRAKWSMANPGDTGEAMQHGHGASAPRRT